MHQIIVRNEVTAARERIERVLGIKTQLEVIPPEIGGGWMIRFVTDGPVDFDFLRPDILPPRPDDRGKSGTSGGKTKSDAVDGPR